MQCVPPTRLQGSQATTSVSGRSKAKKSPCRRGTVTSPPGPLHHEGLMYLANAYLHLKKV